MEKLLQGYTSQDNAYHVGDYPYGFKLRTDIWYWLEYKEGKGYRFGSVTRNPKTGERNKPKYSPYACVLGFMYLNAENHVKWDCVHEFTSPDYVSALLISFQELARDPGLNLWCAAKVALYRKLTPHVYADGMSDLDKWQKCLSFCLQSSL